jgi:hypothetical protein
MMRKSILRVLLGVRFTTLLFSRVKVRDRVINPMPRGQHKRREKPSKQSFIFQTGVGKK